MPTITSHLRKYRESSGLSQQQLAAAAGISRQALIAIEAGRQVPSTAIALAFARHLGVRVEEIFQLDAGEKIEAVWVAGGNPPPSGAIRVALGRVKNRVVAHPVSASDLGADGVSDVPGPQTSVAGVLPLMDSNIWGQNILIAGCAPLIGILSRRVALRNHLARAVWLKHNNHNALKLLKEGNVHMAGWHGGAPRLPGKFLKVNLLRWRQGILTAPGNPHGIKTVLDLLRASLKIAWREEGSGAHALLNQEIAGKKIPFRKVPAFDHAMVADLIRFGAADAGIAIESAAVNTGLNFIPLAEENFNLIIPEDFAELESVRRIIDTLSDRSFKREAEVFRYDMSMSGQAA